MNTDTQELQSRIEQLERRYRRAERRLRVLGGLAMAAVVGAILLSPTDRAALAQQSGATLQDLLERVKKLEHKTQFMHVVPSPDVAGGKDTVFDGCNVRIDNGQGSNAAINGLGNLIVGYNAMRNDASNARTGSHNLILGDLNNYASFGGVVAGASNSINAAYASVTGGKLNTASGIYACVSGGQSNTSSGSCSSISGGQSNAAMAACDEVSGGYQDTANGGNASVSGGYQNYAVGPYSTVSGGGGNLASGSTAAVSGGFANSAYNYASTVSGGQLCIAYQNFATVSGGLFVSQGNYNGWSGGSYHTP